MPVLNREQWVEKYYPLAVKASGSSGIFPETILAAAIVESQRKLKDGNYYPGQSILVKEANNYFAIKADKNWKGPYITAKTSKDATKISKFRKYASVEDSFKGYVSFLQKNSRYTEAGVFKAPNYAEQMVRIAKGGYAEGEGYSNKLKSVASHFNEYLKDVTQKVIEGSNITPLLVFGALALFLSYSNED